MELHGSWSAPLGFSVAAPTHQVAFGVRAVRERLAEECIAVAPAVIGHINQPFLRVPSREPNDEHPEQEGEARKPSPPKLTAINNRKSPIPRPPSPV